MERSGAYYGMVESDVPSNVLEDERDDDDDAIEVDDVEEDFVAQCDGCGRWTTEGLSMRPRAEECSILNALLLCSRCVSGETAEGG